MKHLLLFASCVFVSAALGCRAEVSTTEDSTKIEAEGPKVERGDAPVDLDPGTDKDIDIDTPLPGDK
jgi:hypothetical protein